MFALDPKSEKSFSLEKRIKLKKVMEKEEKTLKESSSFKDTLSLKDFNDFVSNNFPKAKETKYYVELNLISDYFLLLSIFSLNFLSKLRGFELRTVKKEIDNEFHIIEIFLKKNEIEAKMKVLLIQMDRVIKITFESWIFSEHKFKKSNQFHFDHFSYINKKVSNSYKLLSLKELSLNKEGNKNQSQLNYLYLSIAIQSLYFSLQSSSFTEEILSELDFMRFFNTEKEYLKGNLFFEVLSNSLNLIKISSFLNIGSIEKLSRTNKLVKNYFFTPSNLFYKNLYEFSFGRTGFEINEMDWIKSLAKKRLEKERSKQKNSKFESTLIFRTH